MATKTGKLSRNAPCPCGSGMKYKRCCLNRDASALPLDSSRFAHFDSTISKLPRARDRHRLADRADRRSRRPWFEVVFDAPLAGDAFLTAVLLFSDAEMFCRGEAVTLDLPELDFKGPATVLDIRPSNSPGHREGEVLRVVRFRDHQGDDLGEPLLGEWNPPREVIQRWCEKRRIVTLKLEHPQGGHCDIQVERKLDWIEATGAEVGGTVFLDLAEMGARGWAHVLAIEPCPEPQIGPGQRVTGTFRHSEGLAGDLVLESESKPIGVTPRHLFWSVDRSRWVPVGELCPGETVKTLDGFSKVVSYTNRDKPEPVYNIEVDGDHVYRVGESGVLVHNNSAYQTWFQSLEPCEKPARGENAAAFEQRACGTSQFWIVGGGKRVCIDAVEGRNAVDCKAIENPAASAQLGNANEFWAELGPTRDLTQLRRIEAVVADPCNPLTKLIIAVEDQRAVPYWQSLLNQLTITSEVEVR